MFRALTRLQRGIDVGVAAAFTAVLVFAPIAVGSLDPGSLPAVVLFGGALALRRLSPPLAVGIAWTGGVAQMLLQQQPGFLDLATLPVVAGAAAYGGRRLRWIAFASAIAAAPVAGLFLIRDHLRDLVAGAAADRQQLLGSFALFAGLVAASLLLSWTVGLLQRTARLAGERARAAEIAAREVVAEQERVRIARDMHDVVAHSLAVVIAQSDGARLLQRSDPEAVGEALGTIGSTARAALADVRVLLQQLRYEGQVAAQPTLADLDALVERFRASGLDVDLARTGGVDGLGAAVQLAGFRVLQESLTNALRHADVQRPVVVRMDRSSASLALHVSSALDPARPARSGGGHGLIGMRERAAAVGGELTAVPDGDRFVVDARLPAAEGTTT